MTLNDAVVLREHAQTITSFIIQVQFPSQNDTVHSIKTVVDR